MTSCDKSLLTISLQDEPPADSTDGGLDWAVELRNLVRFQKVLESSDPCVKVRIDLTFIKLKTEHFAEIVSFYRCFDC